jgi:hypothetical protein
MPRKEFEAFTRLDASDVNTFLMDQSVMTFGSATARDAAIDTPVEGQVTYLTDIDSLTVYNGTQWVTNRPVMTFAGTAARGSAIPSPVEGMYTHLEDTDRLQFWNGSAWTTAALATGAGLIHLRTTTFTGLSTASFGSDADPVFTSTYDNYRILITSGGSTSANRTWAFRLRANTTDLSSTVYNYANNGLDRTGAVVNTVGDAQSSAVIMPNAFYPDERPTVAFDLFNPVLTVAKSGHGNLSGTTAAHIFHQSFSFTVGSTLSFNGFSLINSSGNFVNGVVSVYGYRKS